jgi:serine protease
MLNFNKMSLYKTLFVFLVCVFQQLNSQSSEVIKSGNTFYLSHKIVLKLKTAEQINLNKAGLLPGILAKGLEQYGALKISKTFSETNTVNNSIGNILTIDYSSSIDPLIAAAKISKLSGVLWAEPKYVYKTNTDFTPNDPSYVLQSNLQQISAPQAWSISLGDTTVVIGIVDTGVQWDHPDLAANIWINTKEIPDNGIDDDHNGYIDDYRGWDFGGLVGTPDNNPKEDNPYHGTHVAGIASAITNNGVGIASIGSKCKLMAVKGAQDNIKDNNGNPYISYGYEGIVYAIDNGVNIINCSWGGSGYSRAAQEIVNYAISKGVLIVASAGNSGTTDIQYPAGYDGVLSVASVDQSDTRSSFTTYGYWVDVCSPGENIYSTWMPNAYQYLSGTSMSSPLAAGLAGLVKSYFPNMLPIQVGEQIRVNCDNIDNLNPNDILKLGGGRINAFKALSNKNSIAVRQYSYAFTDNTSGGNNDGIFTPGEEIQIDVKFRNILSPTSNLIVNLQCPTGYVTLENPTINMGSMNTLDSISYSFKFILSDNVPYNQKLIFILNFNDGSYSDFQEMEESVNPAYLTQDGNNVAMTITSRGNLGFNDYPDNLQGDGFKYKDGSNLLFEGALMYGTSVKVVDDAARTLNTETESRDFSIIKPFLLHSPGVTADLEGTAVFNDSLSSLKLRIETKLKSYSFALSPNDKYIILKYSFYNRATNSISNLFTGIYTDWDMVDGSGLNDEVNYDEVNNFGYVHHLNGDPATYVGCGLISAVNYGFYAIQNDGADGGLGIYDGFLKSEKWQTLSNGISKKTAGPSDVSMVVSSGPYVINAGDSIDVAFAIAAGDNLQDLQNSIIASRNKYSQVVNVMSIPPEGNLPKEFKLDQNFPNPFNPLTTISFTIPASLNHASVKGGTAGMYVTLKVYDLLGKEVATLVNEEKPAGYYWVEFDGSKLSSGIYFYRLVAGSFVESKKAVLIK